MSTPNGQFAQVKNSNQADNNSLGFDYSKLDKFFETNPGPRELAIYFSRMHAGLADILAQIVSYKHVDGDYNFYIRGEITGGIYQLMDFFEALSELEEVKRFKDERY